MWPLGVLLAVDALVHAVVVARYGVRQHNEPFLVSAVVYSVLAVLVFVWGTPGAWGALVWASIGLVGLTVTFNKPQRDKTLDKLIWILNVAIIGAAVYYLFIA